MLILFTVVVVVQGVDWDGIHASTPPIIPEVTSDTDVRHFDDFEEKERPSDQDEAAVRDAVNAPGTHLSTVAVALTRYGPL